MKVVKKLVFMGSELRKIPCANMKNLDPCICKYRCLYIRDPIKHKVRNKIKTKDITKEQKKHYWFTEE